MKDLEKIKSEDLGCQVQDANPGNFAIEQEVAQLVGATVPQPTEPSADDARELGAQLLVFLRRALLPIRSALRTALAAIYAHLDSRCTAYTPAAYAPYQPLPSYDPMGTPPTPRTLPNLLTALTAFAPRKISNGSAPSDGIPDGTSLAHIITEPASVVKLVDDNRGWTATQACPLSIFPNAEHVEIGCESNTTYVFTEHPKVEKIIFAGLKHSTKPMLQCTTSYTGNFAALTDLEFPELLDCCELINKGGQSGWYNIGLLALERLSLPKLRTINNGSTHIAHCFIGEKCANLTELEMPELETINAPIYGADTLVGLTALRMPKLKYWNAAFSATTYASDSGLPNLIDLEVGPVQTNMDVRYWNPTNVLADADKTATFLQNFREHIALRLTANGSGLTLTLSQAVRNAIHAAESTYGIENIIVTQKGWTISPAPGASSQ